MLQLAHISISPPVILAPMAGYTNPVFRKLCTEYGAGACITELISAKALQQGQNRSFQLMEPYAQETPYWVQIFGNSADVLAAGAQAAMANGAHIVDINMGCPVRKVVNNGAGSAWLKYPKQAVLAVEAVLKALDGKIPLTVKIRSGWNAEQINAPELAADLSKTGIAALSIHGRTKTQGYAGVADWDIIARVVDACADRIPVIGNGDVKNAEHYRCLINNYGCQGVMIGRAAIGHPWIFRAVQEKGDFHISLEQRLAVVKTHLDRMIAYKGDEKLAVRSFRSMAIAYLKGFSGAVQARRALNFAKTAQDVHEILLQCAKATEPSPRLQ